MNKAKTQKNVSYMILLIRKCKTIVKANRSKNASLYNIKHAFLSP